MAYDCRFQTTIKDHIPLEYYRFISKEQKADVQLPETKQMFVKKCMVPALYRSIPPAPSTLLKERSERNGLRHSIFTSRRERYIGEWKHDKMEGIPVEEELVRPLVEGEKTIRRSNWSRRLCLAVKSASTSPWYSHGHGSYQTRYGEILYEGEWLNGKRDGYGILCHQGDQKRYNIVFEGFWKGGKAQGKGHYFGKDGSYYEGWWENGVREGFGKMWYADKTYYEGNFHRNKRHGKGLFVYVNGNRYIGDWNTNFKHGFGAFYYMSTGQIQMGHWRRDSCVKSWMVDMKYRQTVEHPTDFSIPEKSTVAKNFKRYFKVQENKSDFRNASTQTDE